MPKTELRISIYIRNGETEPKQNAEPERNREIDPISKGALAPPMPWRPRNRGETLLPSRKEVKEEEDEGAPSPLLFRWRRNAAVAIIITALHQQLHRHHHQLFPSLCSGVTSILPAVIST